MKIDVKKLGYRWKGNHSATASYERGDVVRKNNNVMYHDGNTFITMGAGQDDANTYGALAAYTSDKTQVSGAGDQILSVGASSNLEFQYSDGRNSTAVRKLAKTLGGRHGGAVGRAGTQSMFAIMTDGTVRCWGDNANYKLGVGDTTVNSTLPDRVAFPSDTPPIDEVYAGSHYSNFAIDVEGGLWMWGYNSLNQAGEAGVTTNVGTPEKLQGRGDIPANAVIVDFFQTSNAGSNYSTIYTANWALDSEGNLYGWGNNSYGLTGTQSTESIVQSPTLVPLSQSVNIVKVISFGNRQFASFFITDTGLLYQLGSGYPIASSNNQLTANNTVPELWTPSTQDPVKTVMWSQNRYPPSYYPQYYRERFMLVTENGKIYTWGTNGFGLDSSTHPNYINTSLAAWDSRIDDVKDAFCASSGQGASQYVLKNDGTVWGIGYVVDIDSTDNTIDTVLYSDWTQLNYGTDNEEMWGQGDYGSDGYNRYYAGVLLKKTDGSLFLTGYWRSGVGLVGGGADQASNNTKAFSIVRLPKAVDEWEVLGGDGMNCLFARIGGEVFSAGWGTAVGNDDNLADRYTMSQVIF